MLGSLPRASRPGGGSTPTPAIISRERRAHNMAKEKQDATSGAVAVSASEGRTFDDDVLKGISSLQDAFNVLNTAGIPFESMDDYGNGFEVLEDKNQLVKKPFAILEWRFNAGDMGEFVSATCVTEKGDKVIINDGSTGILRQLRTVTETREKLGIANVQAGLICKHGLRRSDYQYTDSKGESRPATTYYLA